MDKNKVLVTTSTFPRWDGDSGSPFVFELCKRLVLQNHDIIVLAPHAKDAKKFEFKDGMKVYRYQYLPSFLENLAYEGGILSKLRANKLNFLQIPFFLFFQLLALRRIIKIEKINIIHAHWIIPQGLVAVVYKRLFHPKIKIICTSHGSDILGLKSLLTLPLKKYTLKNIDKLTVVSNLLKTEVSKMGVRPPIDILPMGVDLGRFGPDHRSVEIKRKYHIEGSFLIFVGRLSEEKGVKYLIEAMVAVVKEFPDTKLLIIGSGVLETELRNLSNNLNLSKNVIFTGYMQNASLPSYYATADILIGPSLREGFGLVFAEAMACGCPVIASDLPSVSEIIINGQTGFTVKPKDSAAIANRIIQLLTDKGSLERLKFKAHQYVRTKFDGKIISEKYSEILR